MVLVRVTGCRPWAFRGTLRAGRCTPRHVDRPIFQDRLARHFEQRVAVRLIKNQTLLDPFKIEDDPGLWFLTGRGDYFLAYLGYREDFR